MEAIGVLSGVFTLISGVTKLSKNLNEIRDSYKTVALNTASVASQLSTIRLALEAIAEWRRMADTTSRCSKQLDEDLAMSLNCCAILVTVLNSKLVESGFKPGMISKIKYLWLENVLKEYLSNLEGQVRALQLLLTVFQCRTAAEQSRRLQRVESRTVIDNLRAETASLQPDDREPQDASSMQSIDVSVDFDVDSLLLKHRMYKKVYSNYHLRRHHSVSQIVNSKDSLVPMIDHSEKFATNTAEEKHGRKYKNPLQQIASTVFTGDEEIDGSQIPRDGSQTSLRRVAERASLPAVKGSEASQSTCGDNEVPWTNRTVIQSVNNRLDQSTHQDYYEGLATRMPGLDFTTIDKVSSRHHPGSSQPSLQTQNLSDAEETQSFENSRPLSLIDPTHDTASLILSARADSPTIRAPDSPPKSPNDASQLSSVRDTVFERQRTQAELSRLRHEFAAAKSRGDERSAQAFLQKSIELIQETYLAKETSMESKPSIVRTKLTPRRNHIFCFPSLAPLNQMHTRARASQNTAAIEAACSGNDTKLKELLEQGIDVNARSGGSKTLFIHAATYGHIDCMALLKQRGSDELAVDYRGLNALHSAVLARQTAAVEWLLKSYPSTEDKSLHIKPSKTNRSLGRSAFLSHSSLREASSREGFTPIHLAAKLGQVDVLNMLVETGADIEAKCHRGSTALHHAVISNHAPVVSTILSKGAELMAADASGLTPLHHAATSSEVDVINILLSAGCGRSAYDNKGNMPIHLAAGKGRIAAVEALRRDLADLEVETASGESLLHIAVWMNQLQIVEYLLQHKVHANPWSKSPPAKLDSNGKIVFAKRMLHDLSSTPLHSACFAGQYEISAFLLDHEAWPNAVTADGKTPLMLAVESDHTNLVNLLLTRNAKVDAKIPRSFLTVQHIAAQMGNLEILQVLFQHGASLDAYTSDFKYPADYVYLCKDSTKRAAALNWFREIRLRKSAQAREINALKRQRTVEQVQEHHESTIPETQNRDRITLIRQLYPAYHGLDQESGTFPDAPPPYVAVPSAIARFAKQGLL